MAATRVSVESYSTTGQRIVLNHDGTISLVRDPNPHVYRAELDRFGYQASGRRHVTGPNGLK